MLLAVFDFETTDSNPRTCRITEAACAIYDSESQKSIVSFCSYAWDESYEPIHPMASKITGITDEMIKTHGQGPRFLLAQLGAFLKRADFIVGHNIRQFDLIVLEEELKRNALDLDVLPPNIDTRMDIIYPEHIQTRKLGYLAQELGIYADNAHSALHDVHTTASILFKYDLSRTIELSKSPDIYIRADVSFNDKEKAKEKKYFWDGTNKLWMKQIKEEFYTQEVEECDFPVLKMPAYTPPVI